MITLKIPPQPAVRVLHMNSHSPSPGGKDYVLLKLNDGTLLAFNGPAYTIRTGGGAVQHPKKSWQEIVSEKTRKGYTVEGEYSQGSWWSRQGHVYSSVRNIPVTPPVSPPTPSPETPKPKVASQPPPKSDLTSQYPVSSLVKEAFASTLSNEWFHVV